MPASQPAAPDQAILLAGLTKAISESKPLVGKDGLFPATAAGKHAAISAINQGYLTTQSNIIPPATKKAKEKVVVVAVLTDKGRQFVLEVSSPKAILESLLPLVQILAKNRDTDTKADNLRPELEKATATCVKTIEDAYTKLEKSVAEAFAKLEAVVVRALPTPPVSMPDPAPILEALQKALARILNPSTKTAETISSPSPDPAPPPPVTPPNTPADSPVLPSESLRQTIRDAYDHLCKFKEFQHKLVEIPRLYHESVERMPDLSLERFHRELEALNSERIIELHKLNEVNMAKERHLAIEKNDRLYYYIIWR